MPELTSSYTNVAILKTKESAKELLKNLLASDNRLKVYYDVYFKMKNDYFLNVFT